MKEIFTSEIILFVTLSFINVISGTVKAVLTIKAKPFVAGVINALNYTINALVIKSITGVDTTVVLISAFFTNLFGVWITKVAMDKLEKEKLWIYNCTIKNVTEDKLFKFKENLKASYDINSIFYEIAPNEIYLMKIFSKSKNDSQIIKDSLEEYQVKYYITQPR